MFKLKQNPQFEGDLLALSNGHKIVIECKDTSDSDFLAKLPSIYELADKYIFVTTCKMNVDTKRAVESIMKQKLIMVNSKEIEQIPKILTKIIG